MKTIKAYLMNQKDLAAAAYYQSLKEGANLHNAKFWLERVIHIDLMIKALNDGKENTNTEK
jgi:hypothetical protein